VLPVDAGHVGRHPALGQERGELERRVRVGGDRLVGLVLGPEVTPERRDHPLDVAYPLDRGTLRHRLSLPLKRCNLCAVRAVCNGEGERFRR
jgi:hypothetical protein